MPVHGFERIVRVLQGKRSNYDTDLLRPLVDLTAEIGCDCLVTLTGGDWTLVYGAGGYRFTDYVKVGLPLMLLFLAVSLVLIPVIWPL